jgi:hypothetical protein
VPFSDEAIIELALGVGDYKLHAMPACLVDLFLRAGAAMGTRNDYHFAWSEGLAELIAIASDPKLKARAERIVLLRVASLAAGEAVDQYMRELIGSWCRQRLNGRARGRPPTSRLKKSAVVGDLLEEVQNNSSDKREAIIARLAKKHGLKRRRVFEMIEGVDVEGLLYSDD